MSNNGEKHLFGYRFNKDIAIQPTEEMINRLKDRTFASTHQIDSKYITPVKKQCVGNCWAYAATALMESYLIKNGLVSDTDDHIFSETHMTYSEFDIHDDDKPVVNPEGFTPKKNNKGGKSYGISIWELISYFARNKNSVLEVDDPCFPLDEKNPNALPMRDNKITTKKFNRFEVDGVHFLDPLFVAGDPNFIKNVKECLENDDPVFFASGITKHIKKGFLLSLMEFPLSVTT